MPDLHGWITQQIDQVEHAARSIGHGGFEPDEWRIEPSRSGRWTEIVPYSRLLGDPPEAATRDDDQPIAFVRTGRNEHLLMALHDPAAVLRRCEAGRRILNRHRREPDGYWADAAMCQGCGTEGDMAYPVTDNLNDCPELLDLAHAHGLTEEILATLDRPAEGERPAPTGRSLIPDAIAEALYGQILATFLGTRPLEPSSKEKALDILGPDLKKIAVYVPVPKEQP